MSLENVHTWFNIEGIKTSQGKPKDKFTIRLLDKHPFFCFLFFFGVFLFLSFVRCFITNFYKINLDEKVDETRLIYSEAALLLKSSFSNNKTITSTSKSPLSPINWAVWQFGLGLRFRCIRVPSPGVWCTKDRFDAGPVDWRLSVIPCVSSFVLGEPSLVYCCVRSPVPAKGPTQGTPRPFDTGV